LSIRAEINSDNYSEDLKSIERVLTENLEAVVSRQLSEPSHESSEEEFI
jgi:hypothetical protein